MHTYCTRADVFQSWYVESASSSPSALWSTCSPMPLATNRSINEYSADEVCLRSYLPYLCWTACYSVKLGGWELAFGGGEAGWGGVVSLRWPDLHRYLITVVTHISIWGSGELWIWLHLQPFTQLSLPGKKKHKGRERIWLCYTLYLYQTAVNTRLLCCSNVLSTVRTWKHLSSQSPE